MLTPRSDIQDVHRADVADRRDGMRRREGESDVLTAGKNSLRSVAKSSTAQYERRSVALPVAGCGRVRTEWTRTISSVGAVPTSISPYEDHPVPVMNRNRQWSVVRPLSSFLLRSCWRRTDRRETGR